MNKDDFYAECDVCGQRYLNWVGSTQCCGSIAYIIDSETIRQEELEKLQRLRKRKLEKLKV